MANTLVVTVGRLIWKSDKPFNVSSTVPVPGHTRLEFPDLIRYKGYWYCGFREADIHENHPSGKGRIIRSADGVTWQLVKSVEWDGADAGMPRFSITAEGLLMANEWIHFVSPKPRDDGYYYQLDRSTLGLGLTPHSEMETDVASQSLTWFTSDGLDWGSAYACPSGVNTTRFHVLWHNGMAYSIANELGKNVGGTLYRSRDGKSWRVLKEKFIPKDQADECSFAFTPDDTMVALLRGNSANSAMIGVSKGPYYQEWQWSNPTIDWHGDGRYRPLGEVFRVGLGGPKMIRLADGRLIGAGRTLPPERPDGPWRIDPGDSQGKEDGRIVLFWIDPATARLRRFAEMDGTSYCGLFEHEGYVWVTYVAGDRSGIHMGKVKVPAMEPQPALAAVR